MADRLEAIGAALELRTLRFSFTADPQSSRLAQRTERESPFIGGQGSSPWGAYE
jgi:hypothetical protein